MKRLVKQTDSIPNDGSKCLEEFNKSSEHTAWSKEFVSLLIKMDDWHSTRCNINWKVKSSNTSRLYLHLQASVPVTREAELGVLHEKQILPTPVATEIKDTKLTSEQAKKWDKGGRILRRLGTLGLLDDETPSRLNPLFVEEMMGFPKSWTLSPFLNSVSHIESNRKIGLVNPQ